MKTTYLKNAIVQHIVGIPAYAHSGYTSYIGLFTADPTVDGSLDNEVAGGSYARQAASWGTASDGALPTDADLDFTSLPACTVKYWGILDASTGGNLLEYFPIASPLVVGAGNDLTIDAGNLILREA